MKECPKCFFLNPDHAEFCIKCRFHIGMIYGKERVHIIDSRGWSSPSQGSVTGSSDQQAPADDTGAEGSSQPEAAPVEAQDGAPEAPMHGISKEYEDPTLYEVGGYRLGGTPADPLTAPPPSDFHAVLAAEKPQPKRWRAERKTRQANGLPKPLKESKTRRPRVKSHAKMAPRKAVSPGLEFLPPPTGDMVEPERALTEEQLAVDMRPLAAETLATEAPAPTAEDVVMIPEPAATEEPAPVIPASELIETHRPAVEPPVVEAPPPVKPEVVEPPAPEAPEPEAVWTRGPAAESLVDEVLAPAAPEPEAVETPEPAAEPEVTEKPPPTYPPPPEAAEIPKPSVEPPVAKAPPPVKPEVIEPPAPVPEKPEVIEPPTPAAPEPEATWIPGPATKAPLIEAPPPVKPEVVEPPEPVRPKPAETPEPAAEPAVARKPALPEPAKPALEPAYGEIAPPGPTVEKAPVVKKRVPPPRKPVTRKEAVSDAAATGLPVVKRSGLIPVDKGKAHDEVLSPDNLKRVSGGRRGKAPESPAAEMPRIKPGTGVPLERPRDEE